MEQNRTVLCPTCGHSSTNLALCRRCGNSLDLDPQDHHDVAFVGVDDGYHSWYSQPTSIHERYRCKNYPSSCGSCIHNKRSDTFCMDGKVDIRRMRRELLDGEIRYEYKDWIE